MLGTFCTSCGDIIDTPKEHSLCNNCLENKHNYGDVVCQKCGNHAQAIIFIGMKWICRCGHKNIIKFN